MLIICRSNRRLRIAQCLINFPRFVPFFGQNWYKKRRGFPEFVRDLGQNWYKKRKDRSERALREL
ncbi:hypothetical protein HMPREF1583_01476, partial [Gardnerella vaginalis JCP8151B]